MIQKLLCWLLGHKTVFQAATGHVLVVDTTFDRNKKCPLMTTERSPFCLRCWVIVHHEAARQAQPPQPPGKDMPAMAALGYGIVVACDKENRIYRSIDYGVTWVDCGVLPGDFGDKR